jgi:salicylate hydroxylase
MKQTAESLPILVAGGGIGGLAAALALTRQGFKVKVLEKSPELGEIGAGVQFGPNAFAALDALGVGEKGRARAVYTDDMVMHDCIDESVVGVIETGQAFLEYFGNPYAVCHRADVHMSLLEGARETDRIEVHTSTEVVRVEQDDRTVTVFDQHGNAHHGLALIAADGVKSAVREQYVGDDARISGHVVYRAVVDKKDFPKDLSWNSASIWVGPNHHLVHYPLRGGEQFNVVVTFHSREKEEWSVTQGSKVEVESYFQVTLLGDAAHVTLQYLAQGACMAIEDAVTLGEAIKQCDTISNLDFEKAFDLYQRSRITRTARIVLSSREMGKLYHAQGVERLVRNDLWKNKTQADFYRSIEWLYGWKVENCLAK